MKILILGKNGQVGWELQRTMAVLGNITSWDMEEMDLTDEKAIRTGIRQIQPKLIVNAAAYTAVDKAEEEPNLAMSINGIAPGILAEEAKKLGAGIIHYSTDYVFDGSNKNPYIEDDKPNPINIYGKTKLAGEEAIEKSGCPHLILRTSWVYGLRGKNFLKTMMKLLGERKEINVVNDQIGSPTWSRLIAEATALIVAQGVRDIYTFMAEHSGIYHLTSSDKTSWYGFVEAIRRLDANKGEHICQRVQPIPTDDYPTPAKRPKYSVLDNNKINRVFGVQLPQWEDALAMVLADLEAVNERRKLL